MSRIEVLIQQLCPQGVEIFSLGELGVFENIGVDKKTNAGEKKVMLLNFMDVMRNKHIHKNILSMEVSASDSKIEKCDIKQHDLFITPTSETRDEIGFAAVAIEDISDSVYSYHVMRYRLNNKNAVTPYFIRYLFESDDLRIQIYRASKGLTRYGLSAKDFAKLTIPFPPLDIQEEIVKTLDLFTKLEAELEAELEARKTQYNYYRDALLSFEGKEVEWKTLGEVYEFKNGLNKGKEFFGQGTPIVNFKDVFKNRSLSKADLVGKVEVSAKEKILYSAQKDDLFFTRTSETQDDIGMCCALLDDIEDCVFSGFVLRARPKTNLFLPKFCSYFLTSNCARKEIVRNSTYTTRALTSGSRLAKIKIPIPSLSEQEKIVNILDQLHALVNDISTGLPAEIQARRKQYEYYRNRLLTFKELANG